MKYKVEYYNIQGFLGHHVFHLSTGINSIFSKFNGTGKSTFFDCLRLIAAKENYSKDDLYFMVNHNATEAFFRMTNHLNEAYGFFLNRDTGMFFYTRQLPEEEVEYSEYVFPEMNLKLNLFVKNITYVNIADRFIDLFSSSNAVFNSGLVQELMLHDELEKVYAELLLRMENTKNDMNKIFSECNTLLIKRDCLPYYSKLQDLKLLLQNDELLYNYNNYVLLLKLINYLTPKFEFVPVPYCLQYIFTVKEHLSYLSKIRKYIPVIYFENYLSLYRIKEGLYSLYNQSYPISEKKIKLLQYLQVLKSLLNQLQRVREKILIPKCTHFFSVKEALKYFKKNLLFIHPQEKYDKISSCLFFLSTIEDIAKSKKKEQYYLEEYTKCVSLLQGHRCPTCKQLLGEMFVCEHLF